MKHFRIAVENIDIQRILKEKKTKIQKLMEDTNGSFSYLTDQNIQQEQFKQGVVYLVYSDPEFSL